MQKFRKFAGYEINTKISQVFSYTLHEKSENEIKEIILFKMISKVLRINLTKRL